MTSFRVYRSRRGDLEPHFEDFEVEVQAGATVLDALLAIRREMDPSLVVRHSCMHASCGTCGVRVDGRERLACDTRVADVARGKTIRVEPLVNQRVVADLATDMLDFQARLEPVGLPLLRTAESEAGAEPPDGIKSYVRFESCIECGLCLSACPVAHLDADFIGPAALAAAERIVEEPRGRDVGTVLALASEPDSAWRCRDAMQCTAVCPSAVEPATALSRIRRRVAVDGARRLFGRR
jgi:succinate dehydrogenase / fumarate reductase iron-sulfur subunit